MSPDARRALAKVTAAPSPANALRRRLLRAGVRFVVTREEAHEDAYPQNAAWKIQPYNLAAASEADRTEFEALEYLIKLRLQAEWYMHEYSGLPYCTCGSVDDTMAALWHAQSRPIDLSHPDARQCLVCHPEIEESAYGQAGHERPA